ncbi:Secreted effector protein SseB [Sodalis praecaptivus]|uniref:secretion protein n=1 Tax=Sodalis praecaptivus TaxID=1239307 RepID=UPI0027F40AD6|nr:secretion protein [Sodalis praecaptivus]CAJ0993970.1 Secreted effector protein SseB [Sodalis praecaptivus]
MSGAPIPNAMSNTLNVTLPADKASANAAAVIDRYEVNPFSTACNTLLSISQLMEEVLSDQYNAMQQAANRAHATKDMSNRMDKAIADVSKKDEKGTEPLPDGVYDYMLANGILVEGKTIAEYMGKNPKKLLNKGELSSIRASLDNSFNGDTDLLKQKQILLDKYSNTYNAMLEGAKSCMDKWGRLLNDIIRG